MYMVQGRIPHPNQILKGKTRETIFVTRPITDTIFTDLATKQIQTLRKQHGIF